MRDEYSLCKDCGRVHHVLMTCDQYEKLFPSKRLHIPEIEPETPTAYDDVDGVIAGPVVDMMVTEWEGGQEQQLYDNLCALAKSHEVLRQKLKDSESSLSSANDARIVLETQRGEAWHLLAKVRIAINGVREML